MNLNDSCLSTTSTGQPAMARIVANVVDMQHNLVTQYQSIVNSLDSLKLEIHTSVQTLREDLRRSDDRAQKQVDELRRSHEKEVDRLLDLIKTLLVSTQNSQIKTDQDKAPIHAYNGGVPSANFFGVPNISVPDPAAQYAATAAYLQMQEQQMRLMMGQGQAIPRAGMPNQARWNGMFPPLDVPTTVLSQSQPLHSSLSGTAVPATGQPVSTVVPPNVMKPAVVPNPIASSASTMTPPKPTLGTVNLPISNTLPQIGKENQIDKQNDEKPPALTPQVPKTTFSFSSSTTTPLGGVSNIQKTAPSSSLFDGVKSSSSIFGSPSVEEMKQKDNKENEDDDEHEHAEEFEPQVDFKPLIPLPELVKVVTGEENEETVFEERCKLYRFSDDTKEWKERGTGILKVLEDPKTGRRRIVMRREQIHKVCANHPLTAGMMVQPMAKQEKAMTWHCEDFSEEQLTHEKLSARFASVEIAKKFKKVFDQGVKAAESSTEIIAKSAESNGLKKEHLNEKKDIIVKEEEEKVVTRDTKEERNNLEKGVVGGKKNDKQSQGFGDAFKPKPGSWECTGCYASNTPDATVCVCCGTGKNDEKAAPQSVLPPSVIPIGTGTPKFTFGVSAAVAAKDPIPTNTSGTPKSSVFGGSLTESTAASPAFSFGRSAAPVFGGSIFGGSKTSVSSSESVPISTTTSSFSFLKKAEQSTPSTATASPITFSFSKSTASTPSSTVNTSVFAGGSKLFGASKPTTVNVESEEKKEETTKIFGSEFTGGLSFASLAKTKTTSIFDEANVEKAKAEFANLSKSKLTVKEEVAHDQEKGADEEYEPDVEFQPVIPLPDLIDVVTGEENEEIVFKTRAKLFRFVKDLKEYKERGIGEVKILHNPTTNKYRVVMRREHVHKICTNFAILPSIELNPKKNMPSVYTWACRDYAENVEGSDEVFTMKFKTPEIAREFHDKFVGAQKNQKDSNA